MLWTHDFNLHNDMKQTKIKLLYWELKNTEMYSEPNRIYACFLFEDGR
jgi:hypothetical protein